ncbi:hypothetical protein MRX96_038820 [Rhipicephalus microplus]
MLKILTHLSYSRQSFQLVASQLATRRGKRSLLVILGPCDIHSWDLDPSDILPGDLGPSDEVTAGDVCQDDVVPPGDLGSSGDVGPGDVCPSGVITAGDLAPGAPSRKR